MSEDDELQRAIQRVVSRVLTEPVTAELLERMKAYGSPERSLVWWLTGMGDFVAYARTLTNREIAESLNYNAAHANTDTVRVIMQEAARRLRDDRDPQFVDLPPRDNPPLKAYAVPD
jgi:hypothetical protein